MHAITITINVDAAAAVRQLRGQAGPVRVELDDATIQQLTVSQRDALVAHLSDKSPRDPGRVRWGDPLTMHAPPVGDANPGIVAMLLDHRAARMRTQEDARACATQRALVDAIRGADGAMARERAAQIVRDGLTGPEAMLLAATRHPAIRDALAQIYQVDDLERAG